MLDHYPLYSADAAEVRRSAFTARGGSKSVSDLMGTVGSQHQRGQDAAQGTIKPPLVAAMKDPKSAGSAVCRKALWASMWVECWADAIETYNHESPEPPSIDKLNQKIDDVYAKGDAGLAAYLPAPYTYDGGLLKPDQRKAAEGKLKSLLDAKWERLKADLDDEATRVQTKLGQAPNAADVKAAWKAGNLPEYAALVWPDLGLNKLPIKGVDPDLLGMSPDEVRDRIKNQTKDPLTDAEVEYLNINYPDVMAEWEKNWKPEGDMLIPPGSHIPGIEPDTAACPVGGTAYMIGPDGKVYPILKPPSDPREPGGLNNEDGDWSTRYSRWGNIFLGDEHASKALYGADGAAGGGQKLHGPQAVTGDPSSIIAYGPDGEIALYPSDSDHPFEPEDAPPGLPSDPNDPVSRRGAVGSGFDMVIGAGEGVATATQIDSDKTYAGNVVLQTAPDGTRRAVVQVANVVQNGDGPPYVVRDYASVGEDGHFVHWYDVADEWEDRADDQ